MATTETSLGVNNDVIRLNQDGSENKQDGYELTTLSTLQAEPKKTRSNFRLVAIMIALMLSLFIAALDQTIIATAIPTISAEFQSASGYVWVGGAYLLANAAALPIWAKLSDIWGRKPILMTAVTLFFSASIVCATAVNMKMLIIGRAFQGTAAGGLIQLVNITISDLFSMRSRSLYLGLVEFVWAVAGGGGPVVGGAFTELVSWRWNFWINLPICGTTFLLLLIFLDVHNPRTGAIEGLKAIDWFGILCVLSFVLMLLLGLNFGGAIFPWNSPTVICLIVFGCFMSVLFIFSEKKLARYPLMPLALFRERSNVGSLIVAFCQGMVFIGGEYYLPLFFQSVRQMSPLHSGLLILPVTVTEAVGGMFCGIMIHRTGRYLELIWVGLTLMLIGNGMYIHLNASSSLAEIIAFELVAGAGAGLLFEPPLIALQAFVSQDDTATATATFGFIRNLATSFSIVIGGVLFSGGMQLREPVLRDAGVSANVIEELTGGDAAANVRVVQTITDAARQLAVKQAFAWSLRNLWIFYTCVAAVGLIASLFIKKRVLSKEHTETKTGLKKAELVATTDVRS
ncbi:hypothetical protein W97_00653 [Coniosporium apollinis CBS 100218]|uniref:Major facilitator superfamily (MFS) profile domain-containing protein n=1 Tax=Coniosporium apollinis (strain CBS 100218) TaxID=1168221 RepID=R7YHS2_CONA1|nr:uncharacterized protein W97_00653 [Coniosporium apollinis CBS 100218]EON61438.1 hypothetical protein W97_00653 [Coniosporium apollinis CBS 100218]